MSLLQDQLMDTPGPHHQRGRTVPSGQLGSKISSRSSEQSTADGEAEGRGNGGKPTSAMGGMAFSSVTLQQQPCMVTVASNNPMSTKSPEIPRKWKNICPRKKRDGVCAATVVGDPTDVRRLTAGQKAIRNK